MIKINIFEIIKNYDPFFDDIEKFINKSGYTFGENKQLMRNLIHSICMVYIHGIATESEYSNMIKRFIKEISKNIESL